MKVDEQYSPIKTNILMLSEHPYVSTAYHMLYQEQKHKELTRLNNTPSSKSLAFTVNRKQFYDKSSTTKRFYKPSSQDSTIYARNRPGAGFKLTSNFFCDHCKIHGHTDERCFKLNGYPPGFKQKKLVVLTMVNLNLIFLHMVLLPLKLTT